MGFRQVFAACSFPFDQVGHRIKPETVDTKIEPEIEDLERGGFHLWIVVVKIGLMRKEAMPEIGFGNRIVGPIAHLIVFEDDSRFLVFGWDHRTRHSNRARDLQAPRGEIFETRYADRWCGSARAR